MYLLVTLQLFNKDKEENFIFLLKLFLYSAVSFCIQLKVTQ